MDIGEPMGALENLEDRPGKQADTREGSPLQPGPQPSHPTGSTGWEPCHFCHLTLEVPAGTVATANTGQIPHPITEGSGEQTWCSCHRDELPTLLLCPSVQIQTKRVHATPSIDSWKDSHFGESSQSRSFKSWADKRMANVFYNTSDS